MAYLNPKKSLSAPLIVNFLIGTRTQYIRFERALPYDSRWRSVNINLFLYHRENNSVSVLIVTPSQYL